MKVIKTKIKGLFEIKINTKKDGRGYFMRVCDNNILKKKGIRSQWIQYNESFTKKKGTLRGFHYQEKPFCEAKLVRVVKGCVQDIIIDLRKKSKTYKSHISIILKEKKNMVHIPRGCAHGFCTLKPNTLISYYHDNIYVKSKEKGILWNSRELKIKFKTKPKYISAKDKKLKNFSLYKNFNV